MTENPLNTIDLEVELKPSNIWVLSRHGSLYFIRASSEEEARKKFVAAQIADGKEPIQEEIIGHRIFIWE
jgi:hypothetical protein